MTLIVRSIARWMIPSIFLLGVYVVLHGHLTPGGGFAGGVLVAGSFVLSILAFGVKKNKVETKKEWSSLTESIGIFLFWFLAFLGILWGSYFFLNVLTKMSPGARFHLFSAGSIPLYNLAIGIEVASALFTMVFVLMVFREKERP